MQVRFNARRAGNSLLNAALAVMIVASSTAGISQGAEPLKADMEKSKITFVGHKADGKHEGGFKKFELDLKADFEEPTKSTLRIEIATESIWSDDEKLTAHLKNADFFDVRKHPKIVFESTKIEHSEDDGKVKLTGKLTLLGKTEELTVPATVEHDEETLKLTADFKLDRTKWGMTYGEGKVNKEVDVKAVFVFKQ